MKREVHLEDIDMNPDYVDWSITDGHIMHEVKRKGREGMIEEYWNHIEDYHRDWSKVDFCYLLGILEELYDLVYEDDIRLDKYMIDPRDMIDIDELGEDAYKETLENALEGLFKRGFVFDSIDEAV